MNIRTDIITIRIVTSKETVNERTVKINFSTETFIAVAECRLTLALNSTAGQTFKKYDLLHYSLWLTQFDAYNHKQ